ncbi:MAG: cation:proton antiporter [Candidatus Pacebacteria bacterium]|nr:cation:proton antiporter [Candidatus Paceibacterota bacterium]
MSEIFLQLGVVMGVAIIVTVATRFLKQPLIVSYIITGLIISIGIGNVYDFSVLESFAHLGAILLLFLVGLGLNPELVREMSRTAFLTGLGQIIFTSILGYLIGIALGFNEITSLYLAIAFTFSSTVIVIKILHERKDEEDLYGRIVIGLLLVQDLVAMIFLIFVSAFSKIGEGGIGSLISLSLFNLSVIALFSFVLGYYLIPKVDRIFAKNSEALFIFSLAICFAVVAAFYLLDFPIEIGALLAGVILASSPYQREIASRIKPLRDFFLVIFFVMMGFSMSLESITQFWKEAAVFSIFILLGNPLVMMIVMRLLGYSKKTGFYSGLAIAQISEFSLVLLALGATLNHINQEMVSFGTLVGLITITASSYMIFYADKLYKLFKDYLFIFDVKEIKEKEGKKREKKYGVVVFGFHRLGGGIMKYLKKMRTPVLIVDYDPKVVENLRKKKIDVQFGDASDLSFLETLPLRKAKLVVSTIPEIEDNLIILKYLEKIKARAATIMVAEYYEDAKKLYHEGVEYVVMPPHLGRRYIGELVGEMKFDKKKYFKERKKHLKEIALIGE